MKISDYSINDLKKLIIGDKVNNIDFFPYLNKTHITYLFNLFAPTKHIYPNDWKDVQTEIEASRASYAGKRLSELNDTHHLNNLFEEILTLKHFNNYKSDLEKAVGEVNNYFRIDGYKVELVSGTYKVVGDNPPDEIKVTVHFEDIQSQILTQINNAKYIIWLAVAWFTDKVLMNALEEKQKQGLDVKIIVLDDDINRDWGILNVDQSKRGFDLYKSSEVSDKKLHQKFCIFDLRTVIHGSYNWTIKATQNREEIAIIQSREAVEKYADEFMTIKKKAFSALNV